MISFFAFSGLLNFILGLFLGILVYLKGRRKLQDISFALYFFSVAFWSFGYFFWQISTEEKVALLWSRFLMAGAIFIPIFYFHFIVSFLSSIEKYKKSLYAGYILTLAFFLTSFTPYFVRGVEQELFFPFWPKPGIIFHFFLLMFFGLVVYGWYLLIKSLRERRGATEKQQIKYFLLGTAIGFMGGSTNYLLWYGIPIPPYGNILVIFGIVLVAFAVLRYHLFEIKVILTEILVGIMGIILVVLPFVMPTGFLKALTAAVFIFFCVFAYYLVKATHQESKRREEAEKLTIQERGLRQKSEKLAKEFKRLDRAKTQFLLATQHHLRTPLSIMKNYTSMILEGSYGRFEATVRHPLSGTLVSIERLIKLVNEFLDVSQLQLGKGILKKKKTNIMELLRETMEELLPIAREKRLYLKLQPPSEPLPEIELDQGKMKSAIFNIIDNSLKYTQKGGVTIRLKIKEAKLQIAVSDTGIGISKEDLRGLFEKTFERGEEAEKLFTTGRGIGLYISRVIIEAHQGKIWAESEGEGKGSTFYVELPMK